MMLGLNLNLLFFLKAHCYYCQPLFCFMKKILTTGFAMFAMLFGAGNVVFPLILGRDSGHQLIFALLGFCITAVVMPLLGLFATMLNHGDYKSLLAPLGKIPTFIITTFCMILLGPLALTPRCVAISYAAIKMYTPSLSIVLFSIICAFLIFLCTVKNNLIIDLLGKFLGPLKIILLLTIIAKGLFAPAIMMPVALTKMQGLTQGLLSGYGTCDLLAIIFLSSLILSRLKKGLHPEQQNDSKAIIKLGLQASLIGGGLLALVYAGFCVVAGFHGAALATVDRADIFSALAIFILGEQGGFLANITVAIACLTTAIALTAMFAMYLHKDLSRGRINYIASLLITTIMTACMSSLGFASIMKILMPIMQVIYPLLILYIFGNLMSKWWKFKTHQPLSLTIMPETSDWED